VRTLYLLSVWLHILAASAWVGGMLFLVFVVVPWLRSRDRAQAAALLRETGLRFRTVGWVAFGLLFVTGAFNLSVRGVTVTDFTRHAFVTSAFGVTVSAKLACFGVLLALSAVHDFFVGPQATIALEREPGSPRAERLRKTASVMGRVSLVLALLMVALGVSIVRGVP